MSVSVRSTPLDPATPPGMTLARSSWSCDPDDRDQIELAGDGVDLADAVEVGDRLRGLGDLVDLALDQHDGVDLMSAVPSTAHARSRTTARPWPPEMQRVARPSDAPRSPHLVGQRQHDAGAAHPDRMAQRDPAAVDVQPVSVELQLALAGDHLRGERLVDLDQVDIGEREPGRLEHLLRGRDRPDAHDLGRHARPRHPDDAGQRLASLGAGPRLAHQHHCRRAVGDAATSCRPSRCRPRGTPAGACRGTPGALGARVLVLRDGDDLARLPVGASTANDLAGATLPARLGLPLAPSANSSCSSREMS